MLNSHPGPPAVCNRPLLISCQDASELDQIAHLPVELFDLKTPAHGPLGRPSLETAEAFASRAGLAGIPRSRLSIAMGELLTPNSSAKDQLESHHLLLRDETNRLWAPVLAQFRYVKVGLSAANGFPDWPREWARLANSLPDGTRLVPVAYADANEASAPSPEVILNQTVQQIVAHRRSDTLLIDTFTKDGRTLLEHRDLEQLISLKRLTDQAGIRLACAGSLNVSQARHLMSSGIELCGARGAFCEGGEREDRLNVKRVEAFLTAISESKINISNAADGASSRR